MAYGTAGVELSWLIDNGEVIEQYFLLRITDFHIETLHLRQSLFPLGASLFGLLDLFKRMTLGASSLQ